MPDMRATILQAVQLRGNRILADKDRLCIVLEDLSPELQDDLAFIEKVYNNDVGKLLLQACTTSGEKRRELLRAADVYLDEENGRNPKWRKRLLSYFERAVGDSLDTGDNSGTKLPRATDGECTYIHADGTITTGIKRGGVWNGPFKKVLPNGAYFEGTRVNGKTDGKLRFVDVDGTITDGIWFGDNWNGPFTKTYPNGATYKGSYRQGIMCGELEYKDEQGSTFICAWENGNWNGMGMYWRTDGSKLTAKWVDGEVSGPGTIYYQNGSIYKGGVANFRENGQGEIRFKNGVVLTSFFSDGRISSREKADIAFPDGSSYVGGWDGTINGEGVFTTKVCRAFKWISCRAQWKKGSISDSHVILQFTQNNGNSYIYRGKIQGFQIAGEGALYEKEKDLPTECLIIGQWNNGRFTGKGVSKAVRNAEKQLAIVLEYIAGVVPLAGGAS